jgi:hypothetical protein
VWCRVGGWGWGVGGVCTGGRGSRARRGYGRLSMLWNMLNARSVGPQTRPQWAAVQLSRSAHPA